MNTLSLPLHLHKASMSDRSIGAILVDTGKLTLDQAERILLLQRDTGLLFGEAGIRLGFLTDHDVQRALAHQFDYPYLAGDSELISGELIAAYKPFSRKVEALRALRTQLMLRWFTGHIDQRVLAVISAHPGEGRSFLAANLAILFSQLGEQTLLLDADLRKPAQHKLFKLDNRMGLSSILSGRADISVVNRVPHFVDLSVLTAGPIPPNPQELLSRTGLTNLLQILKSQYDVIIIDSPAASRGADTELITVRAGAGLLIAHLDHTPIRHLERLVHDMTQIGAKVVGSVLNEH